MGHGLRTATRGIVEALFTAARTSDEVDAEAIDRHLGEIIKVRAVQEFSASQAVEFVFRLREAVGTEFGDAADGPAYSAELDQLQRKIDRIALAAFDIFVRCREQVCELRINEIKRRVAWVSEKMGGSE